MKKIVYVAPHLSTGGLPQYLFKKIDLLKDKLEVYCIEYEDITGGQLVVQRNRIASSLDTEHFITVGDNKEELVEIIQRINPDYLHLEEIPEYFLPDSIADKIYIKDRSYKIFETSHDSSFDPDNNKRYLPDAFFFVSKWQIDQYSNVDVPKYLAEYPIEYHEPRNRNETLMTLGLDPSKLHILNIGLFTPRKNQSEIFELAKHFGSEVQFHFVGNQAGNFQDYWKPLMENKPNNCIVWGERNDTDLFYSCMDLFLFTSRGNPGNKETMPLVLREALGWRIPIHMYDLDVYQGYFHKYSNVTYLTGDRRKDAGTIANTLGLEAGAPENDINVSYDPSSKKFTASFVGARDELLGEVVRVVLKDSYNGITNYSLDVHYNVGASFWFLTNGGEENFNGYRVEIYHGDIIIYDKVVVDFNRSPKLIPRVKGQEIMIAHDRFDYSSWWTFYEVFLRGEYQGIKEGDVVVDIGANLGYLSLYAIEKGASKVFSVEPFDSNFNNLCENVKDFPEVVPIKKAIAAKDEGFTLYLGEASSVHSLFSNSNTDDEKEGVKIHGTTISTLIREHNIEKIDFLKVDCEGGEYALFEDIDELYLRDNVNYIVGEIHKFAGSHEDYVSKIKNKLIRCGFEVKENGSLNLEEVIIFTATKKPKIKIVHLLNNVEGEREKKSIESLSQMPEYGIQYEQRVTPIYKDKPPTDFCNRPESVSNEPGHYMLGPGHYGCFSSHRAGILNGLSGNVDAIVINECDSILQVSPREMSEILQRGYELCIKHDLPYVSFGKKIIGEEHIQLEEDFYVTNRMSEAHCILIPKSRYEYFKEKFSTCPWDAADLWYNIFIDEKKGIFSKPYALQHPGHSSIDWKYKDGFIIEEQGSHILNSELDDCTVIIQTCDKHEFLWKGLYLSFKQYWNWDINWPVYVCTEDKVFPYTDSKIGNIQSPLSEDANGFSTRLIDILKKVKTKNVLYMQDDMWPIIKVDKSLMYGSLHLMKHFKWNSVKIHEKNWGNYTLEKTHHFVKDYRVLKHNRNSEYLLTHNASLWDRDYLLSIMIEGENPWKNEFDGTARIQANPEDPKSYHIDYKWYYQPGVSSGGNFTEAGQELLRQVESRERYRIELDL